MADDAGAGLLRKIRADYDRIAGEYARKIYPELEGKPFDRELLNRFAKATENHGAVCDLGCGPGHVARFLRNADADVFGIDLSPGMVAQARALNPEIEFRQGNMLELPLPDGSLAGIAAFYSVVNLPFSSLDQVFSEMERVLIPGGLLLLAFHVGDGVIRPAELWGQPVSMEFFYFETAEIERKLRAAGFEIEETVERGPYAPEVEHQSRRAYIFARVPELRTAGAADLVALLGAGGLPNEEREEAYTSGSVSIEVDHGNSSHDKH
ncbi:MAG TPA: class I SAM-dependent methyltransferase [Terracidiphilus sp.]|nr:class I SAM-dependent methyltransferase [Terracidiphilus sp.]